MKLRIACLTGVLSLLTSVTAYADDVDGWPRQTFVGIHAGAAFATTRGTDAGDPPDASQYRTGFTGGGMYTARLVGGLSLQAEIDFTVKGSRFDTGFPGSSETSYMSYLELPVLMRGSIPASSVLEFYGYLGPSVGFLLDAHTRFDDGRFYESNRGVKPIDIGLTMGAGVAVRLRNAGAVTFDVRYNHGLRNWIDNPVIEDEAFNRAIYLTVGYRADLATLGRLFGRGSPRGPAEPPGAAPTAAPEFSPGSRR